MAQHGGVERLQVEPVTLSLLRLIANVDEDRMAQLVARRLARVDAVTLDLARGEALGLPLRLDEVEDRLFAGPTQMMQPGIDHAAIGAEQQEFQIADLP